VGESEVGLLCLGWSDSGDGGMKFGRRGGGGEDEVKDLVDVDGGLCCVSPDRRRRRSDEREEFRGEIEVGELSEWRGWLGGSGNMLGIREDADETFWRGDLQRGRGSERRGRERAYLDQSEDTELQEIVSKSGEVDWGA
jgi:hypothetical protein